MLPVTEPCSRRSFFITMRAATLDLYGPAGVWRYDHTHGELVSECTGNVIELTLRDHPFTISQISRAAMAEGCRYALSLSRVKEVRASYSMNAKGHLVIRLVWS